MKRSSDSKFYRQSALGFFQALVLGSILTLVTLAQPQAAKKKALLEMDPANFTNPTVIDNPWMPLKPGTQYVYEGHTVDEDKKIPHRIVFTVTDLVKVISGVPVVVVWDRDFQKDKLIESELTFFAQDNDGNVWHFGQHREVYDEVEFVGGRSWMVGHLEGAKAGIMMKAKPAPSKETYSQGYAPPPFHWTDRARVSKTGQKIKVRYGKFDDVIVIEESSDEEPGALQLKYYARGVGNVGVGWKGKDESKETLDLVEVKTLSPKELEEAANEALKLEKRAYMYATTQPAKR